MFTDFRLALRTLLKSPGFSALIVAVLAVGIGANTTIFSVVYGVLLKPLPFAGASRLVTIRSMLRNGEDSNAAVPDVVDWRAQSKTLDAIAAYAGTGAAMTGRGEAVTLHVTLTTSDLFTVLGVKPMLGRTLTASDDAKGAAAVAVLSESTWEHRFGRNPSIIGEAATLDGAPFTIVGVMPSGLQFPIQAEPIDAWLPLASIPLMAQFLDERGAHFVNVVGRLASRASVKEANAEVKTIAARLAAAYPKTNTNRTAEVRPLPIEMVREYRTGLLVLMSAVAAVLLIACANVASLLLARATYRQKEMAIRVALGARPAHLVRQLLAESLVLSAAGGGLGALLALWSVTALVTASPVEIPRLQAVTLDRGVLLFTTVVSMATGIGFGLAPALYLSRADGGETLKDSGRGSSGSQSRTRQLLVIGEVALSLVLLASAGLLIRSLVALQRVDPGFVAEHTIATELSLPKSRYADAAAQVAFAGRLVDAMRTLPGAASGAVATTLPMSGSDYNNAGPRAIVGIVGDVKNIELAETVRPALYTPFAQAAWPFLSAVVRTSGDPTVIAGSLRAAIVRLDPDQPVGKVQSITQHVAKSVAAPRFTASLVGSFATLALLLAGFGLFSVMAYSVAQRRREIGIRVALGAQAGDVRSMVLGQALRVGSIGLGAGLVAALAATRVLDSLLFGVRATDPATFAGVSALLLAVLMVAAYVPARRAARVDPLVALRTE